MNIQAKKLEIVQLILKTDKPTLLDLISRILKQENITDWWDDLPEPVQRSIEQALEQAERGEIIPHEEVMEKIRKKYAL